MAHAHSRSTGGHALRRLIHDEYDLIHASPALTENVRALATRNIKASSTSTILPCVTSSSKSMSTCARSLANNKPNQKMLEVLGIQHYLKTVSQGFLF